MGRLPLVGIEDWRWRARERGVYVFWAWFGREGVPPRVSGCIHCLESRQAHSGSPSGHAFSPLASSLLTRQSDHLPFSSWVHTLRTAAGLMMRMRPALTAFNAASKHVVVPFSSWAQARMLPSGCATHTTPGAPLTIASAASKALSGKMYLATTFAPFLGQTSPVRPQRSSARQREAGTHARTILGATSGPGHPTNSTTSS